MHPVEKFHLYCSLPHTKAVQEYKQGEEILDAQGDTEETKYTQLVQAQAI
jgi:hypothetical protein